MTHRTAVAVAVLAGTVLSLGSASAASAALTGSVGKPCYAHIPARGSEPIVVTLAGGTPGAHFIVSATAVGKALGSAGTADGTFDAAGNGTAQLTDVFPPSGSIGPIKGEPLVISARDSGAGTASVETPIAKTLITNVAMAVSAKPRNPRKARAITVSGTPFAGQALYGFVVKGKNPKVLRRLSLGTADGCGYLKSKGIVAPKSFRRGTYRFYVNAGPKLNKALAIGSAFQIGAF
jgi:hypothetical protein